MIYIRSIGAGIVGSVVAVFLFLLIEVLSFALALGWPGGSGSGGIGAVSVGVWPGPILVAVSGFVLGFWWEFRKRSRRRHTAGGKGYGRP